jgi:acyl carrier protein
MPDAKRGLTISISWDIKKESVLRRETVCPPKGRRERLPWSAQREDAKLKQKETAIMDTFEKIRALLAEQLDIDPAKITMDSDIMGDFEADSLDIVDMVMTLEDEFGIEVPDDAIENLRTVGDVVKFVDSHKG